MILVKFIAHSGHLSRRKSEEAIKLGFVTINGTKQTDPTYEVQNHDCVKCYGKIIPHTTQFMYIMMNKPVGMVTSKKDPSMRETIFDLLPPKIAQYVDPVGRLDLNSSGLILLSNDGDLVYRLSHPKFNITKTYHVTASRELNEEIVEHLRSGAQLEDTFVRPDKVLWNHKKPTQITIELHSGKYRVIRRLLETFGIFVKKLHRVAFKGIQLKNLNAGEWRPLTQKEIDWLKKE
jgi:23S rRNA pseudouridine2605 synthase